MKTKDKENKNGDDSGKEPSQDTDQTAKLEAEIDLLKQKNSWLTEESKKNASKYKTVCDLVQGQPNKPHCLSKPPSPSLLFGQIEL